MSFSDRFSFRQKPEGLFKWFLHLPVYLFRWRLGFLLGDRFILLTHVGRKSGRTYQTPLEAADAAARFKRYEKEHPKAAVRLLKSMGNSYDGTDEGRVEMMADMPMVAFSALDNTP